MENEIITNEVVETTPEVIDQVTKNKTSIPVVLGLAAVAGLVALGIKAYRDHKSKKFVKTNDPKPEVKGDFNKDELSQEFEEE